MAGEHLPGGVELGADRLGNADHDAADQCAPQAAEAAEHHRLEGDQQPARASAAGQPDAALGMVARSFVHPPPLEAGSPWDLAGDPRYAGIDIPSAESLKDTIERVLPYYESAIAPPLAAEIYGLQVLREEIEDEDHNTTRFVVLSRDFEQARAGDGPVVTTFIFNVRNLPAALYKALGGFATNGVNMTKLESYMVGGRFTATQFYAVVGGTGSVGRRLVEVLRRAGHAAVVVSRSTGADVVSGRGLDSALAGVDAVLARRAPRWRLERCLGSSFSGALATTSLPSTRIISMWQGLDM